MLTLTFFAPFCATVFATVDALTLTVPDTINACEPITCTWTGGQAPYTISFYNASSTGNNATRGSEPLGSFDGLTGSSYTYNVGVPGGSIIIFMLQDSADNSITTPGMRIDGPDHPCALPNQSNSNNVGAIVGGVIGGLALIAAVVIALLFLYKRKKRQHQELEPEKSFIVSYPHDLDYDSDNDSPGLASSPIDNAVRVTPRSGPIDLSMQADSNPTSSSPTEIDSSLASTSSPGKDSRRFSAAAAKLREAELLRKQNAPRSEEENTALVQQISDLRKEVNAMKNQRAHAQAQEDVGGQASAPPAYQA
ncbi:hypothetical protein BDV98DRAFT_127501 [Pterulicium gracile]|uniref:Uncharacterized protein n=1 Tax=Pterulicium gracile TaxID=1884261 RepID=A0A5C3QCY4_9AGAR|nr:hypothetical protein BDV98DRAFT_127501 [Pterula gracilis]